MSTSEVPVRLPDAGLLIGDEWVTSATGGTFEHVSPSRGTVQATLPLAGVTEIDAAVRAARQAAPGWARENPAVRREVLLRIAACLRDANDEFTTIAALESGTPVSVSGGTAMAADYFSYYAGWADKCQGMVIPVFPGTGLDYTLSEPHGVVAALIPWNGPITSIAMKVAPALAAGNTVVLKPSELAPFAATRFGQLAREAGLPAGVLNVVPGGPTAGEALVGHPDVDKISFTGGAATAVRVMTTAAQALTPVVLELGGKSACLVFADGDLDAAAAQAAQLGLVALSGQGCVLPTRLLIEDSVYDDVVGRIVAMTRMFPMGDPLDPATVMGPVINSAACERILGVIRQAHDGGSGTLLAGGTRAGGDLAAGYYIEPTVFGDVDIASGLAQEEIFGPVLSVMRFSSEEEALAMANGTRYGLGAYVHTRDIGRAHRLSAALEAGYVSINGFAAMTPGAPFGGVKGSGFGREGGQAGLEEFLRPKNVFVGL